MSALTAPSDVVVEVDDWLIPPDNQADVDRWLAEAEERIAADVRATLRRIVADALAAYESTITAAGDVSALDTIPANWLEYVQDDFGTLLGVMHRSGSLTAWTGAMAVHVRQAVNGQAWADVVNDAAIDYQRTATNRLARVGDDLWGDIRSKTVDGLAAGMTNEDIKTEVERITGFSEMRADTIARTETVAAYNAGDYAGAKALGEFGPVEKQWLAANDRRTRPSHVAADGQVVAFDQSFKVGGVEMDRPHDPGAPAGEVVNCRCVMILLYPGDTRPDGSTVPERDEPVTPPRQPTPAETRAPRTPRAPRQPKVETTYKDRIDTLRADVLFDPTDYDIGNGLTAIAWNEVPAKVVERSEAALRQIGREVHDEVERRVAARGVTRVTPPELTDAERFDADARSRWAEARTAAARQNALYAESYQSHVQEVLAEIRPMGKVGDYVHGQGIGRGYTASSGELVGSQITEQGMRYLPTDWNESIGFHRGRVQVGQIGDDPRGFSARHFDNGVVNIPRNRMDDIGLIVHEFSHQAESTRRAITAHEWAHVRNRWRATLPKGSRAQQLKSKPLRDLTGNSGYRATERAIDDHFLNHYIGKVYDDSPNANWEVLSMGYEGLVTNKYGVLDGGDDVLRDFVLGTLAVL
jgi:hypothetical protein